MHVKLKALLVIAALLPCVVGAQLAQAQEYPVKPVRVIVPFSPGGAVDGPMRIIAQELSKRLNQQVVVENKPGAGATIGTDMVAKATPDGYTLLLASQTNAISASLYKNLAYDPIEDFAPISLIGREPGVLVVNPSVPAKTFQEFIAYVKEHPGQVDYASSGNGSGQHLFAALLASRTGLKMNHVPYRGSGQATTDLLGGQVQMSIPGTAGMVGHIKNGRLRALAVTGAKRSPQLPDVPTVIESGVPNFEAYVWMGLLAPKGTPQPIIDKLHRELIAVLGTDAVKNYMATAGIEIVGSTPEEFARFFRAERDLWAKVVKDTGAKID
ncbi:MAG TPA: tripartite tricarboxylate transporter substrate binding protein [Burkholderiales bacterium]|nr:tripartite tricarboxylate transporter substrate binding protein [Burkholderiales bacterium]